MLSLSFGQGQKRRCQSNRCGASQTMGGDSKLVVSYLGLRFKEKHFELHLILLTDAEKDNSKHWFAQLKFWCFYPSWVVKSAEVCNFSLQELRVVHEHLQRQGLRLSTCQVGPLSCWEMLLVEIGAYFKTTDYPSDSQDTDSADNYVM